MRIVECGNWELVDRLLLLLEELDGNDDDDEIEGEGDKDDISLLSIFVDYFSF